MNTNAYEEACKEWVKGCSCAPEGRPWECSECTKGLHARISDLMQQELVWKEQERLRAEQGSFG